MYLVSRLFSTMSVVLCHNTPIYLLQPYFLTCILDCVTRVDYTWSIFVTVAHFWRHVSWDGDNTPAAQRRRNHGRNTHQGIKSFKFSNITYIKPTRPIKFHLSYDHQPDCAGERSHHSSARAPGKQTRLAAIVELDARKNNMVTAERRGVGDVARRLDPDDNECLDARFVVGKHSIVC